MFVCVIYFMYLSVPFLISLNQKICDINNLFFIEFFELYCTELLGLASTVMKYNTLFCHNLACFEHLSAPLMGKFLFLMGSFSAQKVTNSLIKR